MKEESYIQMAYLQAVMGNVFGKLTWEHATQQLENTLDVLQMAGSLPVFLGQSVLSRALGGI